MLTSSDKFDQHICIGEYIDSYLPAVDGVIITAQNYARWLNEDHCECYISTAEGPRGYMDTDPFRVIRYNSMYVPKRRPYRFGIPLMDFSFVAEQHHLTPDLVHTHSPFIAGREALRISRQRKIPLVASFHSKYYDDILQVTNSKFLSNNAIKLIVDFYNSADYVWTVNTGTADTLRDYGYKKEIEIIPNGTDFLFPKDILSAVSAVNRRFNFTPEDKVVLFVGQHILQKNLIMLLEAVALCKKQNQQFKVLMIGEGYARSDLINKAAELGIADSVIFEKTEYDREKLSSIYLRADLFAFPSLYDNAPLVVREAAMAQCPSIMIANSNAAENAIDSENAFLCENSADSLSKTIKRALDDDANRKRIGYNASQTISKPWRLIINDVYDRYVEIMAEYKYRHKEYARLD